MKARNTQLFRQPRWPAGQISVLSNGRKMLSADDQKGALPLKILLGNRANIIRVLVNLIGNAIRFTEKGCVILLVRFQKHQKNELWLAFSVEDTGIGIPTEKFEFIFEKFSKINPSYEGKHHGIGLGLSVVKEIVNTIGGEIHVESTLNVGSKFYFSLPFKVPILPCYMSDKDRALEKDCFS